MVDAKLIGPRPITEEPAFPTPFSADMVFVKDAIGRQVLRVEGGITSFTEDRALAEEIVRLLNKEYGTDPVVENPFERRAPKYIRRLVDGSGDDWFELAPGKWVMGGDSTTEGFGDTLTIPQSLARARERNLEYNSRTRDSIEASYMIQRGTETYVLDVS
jgi:hypothetical protein